MAMNDGERRAFLGDVRPAILSLNDEGHGPLASPVWYDQNANGDLWFVTQNHTQKARLMQVGTRITLTVQRHRPPYAYVSAEGPIVSIEPYTLEGDLLPMAVRYLGEAGAHDFIDKKRTNFNPKTSVRLTMRPERFLSVNND